MAPRSGEPRGSTAGGLGGWVGGGLPSAPTHGRAMSWIPKGGHLPRNPEEYPRHPDWLTKRQAAALLGCHISWLEKLMQRREIGFVKKRWRVGKWNRTACFINKHEILAYIIKRDLERVRVSLVSTVYVPPADEIENGATLQAPRVVEMNPLRKWRKDRGYTGRQVGLLLGVGEAMVAAMEHSRRTPSAPTFGRIAELLGVDVVDLQVRWKEWQALMLKPLPQKRLTHLCTFTNPRVEDDGKKDISKDPTGDHPSAGGTPDAAA